MNGRKKRKNNGSDGGLLRRALRDSLPVMAGYLVLGAGFGMIMQSKGLGLLCALSMSVFIYAGSMQYVAIGLITGGASYITVALTTLLVNARHLFYGISVVDKYRNAGAYKPYLAFSLTDETYSLIVGAGDDIPESDRPRYFFAVSALDQIYWVVGSALGSLIGSLIPFSTDGMDFALTALFVTIFVDQWRRNRDKLPAVIGVLLSLVCLLIFGSDYFLIPSMIAISVALILIRRIEAPKYVEQSDTDAAPAAPAESEVSAESPISPTSAASAESPMGASATSESEPENMNVSENGTGESKSESENGGDAQ